MHYQAAPPHLARRASICAFGAPAFTDTEGESPETRENTRKTIDEAYALAYDRYVTAYESGGSMKRVTHSVMDTGEVMEGAVLGLFFPKRQNGFKEGWVAMAQEPMMMLAKSDLGAQEMRVLFAVLAKLDFENFLLLSVADLAREIGMQRPNVSAAITRLEALGVLLRGPKAGRSSTFRLNPSFGWRGSASNHQKALKERMRASNISGIVPARDPNTVDFIDGRTDAERGE